MIIGSEHHKMCSPYYKIDPFFIRKANEYFGRKILIKSSVFFQEHTNQNLIENNFNKRSQFARSLLSSILGEYHQHSRYIINRMKFPNKLCSLSYNNNVVSAGINFGSEIHGFGIDIEFDRSFPLGSEHLILNDQESSKISQKQNSITRSLLRIWTIKEALLKSDPTNSTVGWLSAYELTNPNTWFGQAKLKSAKFGRKFKYASTNFGNGYLSVAISY